MYQNIFVQWKDGQITKEFARVYSGGDRCMDFQGTYVGGYAERTHTVDNETLPLFIVSNRNKA